MTYQSFQLPIVPWKRSKVEVGLYSNDSKQKDTYSGANLQGPKGFMNEEMGKRRSRCCVRHVKSKTCNRTLVRKGLFETGRNDTYT